MVNHGAFGIGGHHLQRAGLRWARSIAQTDAPPRCVGGIRPRSDTGAELGSAGCVRSAVELLPGRRAAEAHEMPVRCACLLYTSDAADEEDSVDLGGRR